MREPSRGSRSLRRVNTVGLITRRSRVQITPPLPKQSATDRSSKTGTDLLALVQEVQELRQALIAGEPDSDLADDLRSAYLATDVALALAGAA